MFKIVEYRSKREVAPPDLVFTGVDTPWEVAMDLRITMERIYAETFRSIPISVGKYLPFLPIRGYQNFISLGEGATPLLRSKSIGPSLGLELYFKIEAKNPTGSFKDRGTAVEISVAKELGAKGIAVASTGNMAASTSCYAAAARIPCFIFVPEGVSASKLAQVISYGGRIVQVKGNYNDAALLAEKVARRLGFYLAGDYAFRIEGAKTAAFEVAEQLGWKPPDAVVVPMGCGTNIAAYYKGFREFRNTGFIDGIPQHFGVQADGARAIVTAFERGAADVEPLKSVSTIASAIAIKDPTDGIKALDAIRATEGQALSVSDSEMLEAQYLLAREEGLFTESSGGAVLAALKRLVEMGRLPGKRVVCVLCGDGLKDPQPVLKVAIKPPTIAAQVEEFLSLYENSFFEGKAVSFLDPDEVIFQDIPSEEELQKRLKDVLEISLSEKYLRRIGEIIGQFLQKGKPITFSDLQDIVQDTFESVEGGREALLCVKDFSVCTGMNRKAEAQVVVDLEGEELCGAAEGVGPVDAIITALSNAGGKKLDFALTGFHVDIRSKGVDAVVYVDLTLTRDGVVSVGAGASPDIIQASIHAFVEAFNGLPRENGES